MPTVLAGQDERTQRLGLESSMTSGVLYHYVLPGHISLLLDYFDLVNLCMTCHLQAAVQTGSLIINAGRHYQYMGDLRELDRCVPLEPKALPHQLSVMVMPLWHEAWSSELQAYPDAEFVWFILQGLGHGFRIGLEYERHTCTMQRQAQYAVGRTAPAADSVVHRKRSAWPGESSVHCRLVRRGSK